MGGQENPFEVRDKTECLIEDHCCSLTALEAHMVQRERHKGQNRVRRQLSIHFMLCC